jgi:hypothetical protein
VDFVEEESERQEVKKPKFGPAPFAIFWAMGSGKETIL